MSYTVLARKYRPETFTDVVGQEWISRTLTSAIEKNRVAHAFLFSGPRGVGKTSMARIFSKALNCKKGPTPEPCLSCEHCDSITRGNDVDVLEIDAASNRGIDHIRALRENVRYAPASSRFKIYIIDEVHMLTMESFNALLKTLEEPPAHVKFIFATTEPQKMPETVRSRCQCYEFRRISSEDITARLEMIAGQESIQYDKGVLQRIAVLSHGGLRDAESLLDQISSLGEGHATFESLNSLTGRLSPSEVGDLVDAILDEDAPGIIDFVDRVFTTGTQGDDLFKDLIDYWRVLMMASTGAREEAARLLPEELVARCFEQAKKTSLDCTLACLQISLEALQKGRWFDDQRVLTEIFLLKMARLSHTLDLSQALHRLGKGEYAKPDTGKPGRSGARNQERGTARPGHRREGTARTADRAEPTAERAAATADRAAPTADRAAPTADSTAPPAAKKEREESPSKKLPKAAPTSEEQDPGVLFQKVLREIEKESMLLASYFKRLEVANLRDDTFELIDPTGGGKGLIDPDTPEHRSKLKKASERALGRSYLFTVQKGKKAKTRRDEIPPMVSKAKDLLDGDLI